MEKYFELFIVLVNGIRLGVLVALILSNFITGVAASIYTSTFRLKEIANFLLSRVLPYVLGYFAVALVALVEPSWEVAVTAIWAVITAALVGAILTNLREMGIELPDFLAGSDPEEWGA